MSAPTRLKSAEAAARWLQEWTTGTLRTDSRELGPGDAFIAWPGHASDGRGYVAAALAAGAATCLVEEEGLAAYNFQDARIASLPGLKAAAGHIAAAYCGKPSEKLDVVAITGTNGKTSTAWWIAQALSKLGRRCGIVGTLGVGEPDAIVSTGLTTPDPVLLQKAFRDMADTGFAACAIEASSIGIVEQRLAGTAVRVAVFTNFTQDHLDYHGGMDAYWAAKRELFGWPGLQAAVLNIDDRKGAHLSLELHGQGLDLWTVGIDRPDARLSAHDVHYRPAGLAFTLREANEGHEELCVETMLIGNYNVANLLGVIAALRALGQPLADAARAAATVTPVPGRMQCVGNGLEMPQLVVDYAHTPDALEKALLALKPLAAARGGKLVCLFGCGGDRDRTKRPLMGAIAAKFADRTILTSDNPRSEAPAQILADIAAAAPAALQIADRREAIARAVAQAAARDVVLLAGKGHEDYQETLGVRRPFSDIEEARKALIRRADL